MALAKQISPESARESAAWPRLFISYRREDSAPAAARLSDLLRHLDACSVFLDSDAIAAGEQWEQRLRAALDRCSALLVLIGNDWLLAQNDRTGVRRLDEPDDFVRRELEHALCLRIRIIPICIDDTPLPSKAALPPSIGRLAGFQASRLRIANNLEWYHDVSVLLVALGIPFWRTSNGEVRAVTARDAATAGDALHPHAAPDCPTEARLEVSNTRPAARDAAKSFQRLMWALLVLAIGAVSLALLQASIGPMPVDARVAPPVIEGIRRELTESAASESGAPRLADSDASSSKPVAGELGLIEGVVHPTNDSPGAPPALAPQRVAPPVAARPRAIPEAPAASALAEVLVALECAGSANQCVAQGAQLVLEGASDGALTADVDDRCRARFASVTPVAKDVRFSLRPRRNGPFHCSIQQGSIASSQLTTPVSLRIESCFCGGVDTDQYGFRCERPCPGGGK
jgi:hypothetical protein